MREIDRDVLVQPIVHGDGPALINVPYWHSSYMPLRYPLLFSQGEQSWTKNLPSMEQDREHSLDPDVLPLESPRKASLFLSNCST